ncbi:MAG: hypothetical protein HFJ58_02260 [Clostridia bacterium]|nr:hypothetical protein [Clostridia bacterium]
MKKLDLKNKEKWERFLKNNENKMLIVIMFTVFIYWIISKAIPNFWVGILIYYLIYMGLIKLYDLIYKNFFASRRK